MIFMDGLKWQNHLQVCPGDDFDANTAYRSGIALIIQAIHIPPAIAQAVIYFNRRPD